MGRNQKQLQEGNQASTLYSRMNMLAAGGPGSKYQVAGARPAGFWAGVWHGLICPVTFIVSLFAPDVRIYEIHNRGRPGDFGFIIGIIGTFGAGGHQTASGITRA